MIAVLRSSASVRRSTAPSATTSALRRSSRGCARRSASRSPIHARASRTAASASTAASGSTTPDWKKNALIRYVQARNRSLSSTGNPASSAMTTAGSGKREIRDQLHAPRGEPRRDRLVHELLDPFAQCLDPAGRERRAHEASDPRVIGRIPLRHADREVLVEGRQQALLEARRAFDRQRHPAGGGEALACRGWTSRCRWHG